MARGGEKIQCRVCSNIHARWIMRGSATRLPRDCLQYLAGLDTCSTGVNSTLTINNDFIGFMGEFTGHPSEAIETHS
jgi:hypothetical protein